MKQFSKGKEEEVMQLLLQLEEANVASTWITLELCYEAWKCNRIKYKAKSLALYLEASWYDGVCVFNFIVAPLQLN